MTPLFRKLNLKGQPAVVVLGAPDSFAPELAALQGVAVHRDASAVAAIPFALAFVRTPAELDAACAALLGKAKGDAIVWFAYPKGSSKKYRGEINRDHGWQALGAAGFEGVRQVAIDEDWSALRFRRVEHIKTMTRDESRAGTAQGKARVRKRS